MLIKACCMKDQKPDKKKNKIRLHTNLSMVQVYRKVQDRQEWRQFHKNAKANQLNDPTLHTLMSVGRK